MKILKEYKINKKSLIGGWFISKKICKNIINFYNDNKNLQTQGTLGYGKDGKGVVDYSSKQSSEIFLNSVHFNNIFPDYLNELSIALENYKKKFIYSDIGVTIFRIASNIKIQHYKKNEGFKLWHCENDGGSQFRKRHLVFMTYLNTVKNAGTNFFYQNLTTSAVEGLTLIWPAGWTHTHRGQISKTDEKYIVTGWYNFDE